jgi:hypothetical protein
MHAAQRSFAKVEGHAALSQLRSKSLRRELVGTVRSGEKSSLIRVRLDFNDEGTRQRLRREYHE